MFPAIGIVFFFSYQDLAATKATASPVKGVVTGHYLKSKISLTLTSKPTFAHIFLRAPGDVQPDKKRIHHRFR